MIKGLFYQSIGLSPQNSVGKKSYVRQRKIKVLVCFIFLNPLMNDEGGAV
jgi:hypothetical protein